MDNPEKYQYKPSEIIAHGGADIRKISDSNWWR